MFDKALLTKLALVAGFLSLAVPANAGEVRNRVADQQARIANGVASGQMTRGEYASSEAHLRAINAQRRSDLRANGGKLTAGEHAQLNRELNRNSSRIYFDKHNLRTQPGA